MLALMRQVSPMLALLLIVSAGTLQRRLDGLQPEYPLTVDSPVLHMESTEWSGVSKDSKLGCFTVRLQDSLPIILQHAALVEGPKQALELLS